MSDIITNNPNIFSKSPVDPVQFIYDEHWLTLSSIGSIFTFGLVSNFRANIFDKIMGYILPPESFDYMKVHMPELGLTPPLTSINPANPSEEILLDEPNIIDFGAFIREAIIWIFMTLILYLLAVFARFPDHGGITFNTIGNM